MIPAPTSIRLKIISDPANLASVRQAVEGLCVTAGFSEKAVEEVGLCVNEALANVIRHAYKNALDRPIEINAELVDDSIEIAIRDWGNGVNPDRLPPKPHDPLKPGGLGLMCLRKMMHHVEFVPQKDGMLLKMSRSR